MRKFALSFFSLLSLTFLIIITGCEKEDPGITSQDSNDVSDEALMDAYFQDIDDMASVAISAPSSADYNGGRRSGTITINDNRFQCNGIAITLDILAGSTPEHPKGKITVDFGTSGCTDLKGNVRKGKVIFTYDGPRLTEGTSVVTTTDNYSINDIKLEGKRTTTIIHVRSSTDVEYHVVLENGKATFPDGTQATRISDLYLRVIKGANPTLDKLVVSADSEASGTTRNNRQYVVTLSEPLEYHRFCALAVSGIKNIVVNGNREIKINYGNGDCDNTVTITIFNMTRSIVVGG